MEVDAQILAVMSAIILAGQVIHTGSIAAGPGWADTATAAALRLLDNAVAATAGNVREVKQ